MPSEGKSTPSLAELFKLTPIPLVEIDVSSAQALAHTTLPASFAGLPVEKRLELGDGIHPSAMNEQARQLLGEGTEAELLEHFSALVGISANDPAGDPFCARVYEWIGSDAEQCTFEWLVRTTEGETRDTQVTLTRDKHGLYPNRVVCLLLDVTRHRRAEYEAGIYRHQLEELLDGRAGQVESAYEDMWRSMDIVSRIVETRDRYTAGHMRRVATLSVGIAEAMGLNRGLVEDIRLAAAVHDLGKVGIPVEILNKPAPLTGAETSLLREHVELGCELLQSADMDPRLIEIVAQHHEREDGSGYPKGLRRDAIGMGAKVIAVADTVESMCADRPHRDAAGINAAVEEIISGKGRLYDPRVVDAMLQLVADDFDLDFGD